MATLLPGVADARRRSSLRAPIWLARPAGAHGGDAPPCCCPALTPVGGSTGPAAKRARRLARPGVRLSIPARGALLFPGGLTHGSRAGGSLGAPAASATIGRAPAAAGAVARFSRRRGSCTASQAHCGPLIGASCYSVKRPGGSVACSPFCAERHRIPLPRGLTTDSGQPSSYRAWPHRCRWASLRIPQRLSACVRGFRPVHLVQHRSKPMYSAWATLGSNQPAPGLHSGALPTELAALPPHRTGARWGVVGRTLVPPRPRLRVPAKDFGTLT